MNCVNIRKHYKKTIKMSFYVFMLVFMCAILPNDGHRILGLFPHPGASHFHVFYPIMRGLAEAGHSVTVVSYFPTKYPHPRYTDILLDGKPTELGSIDLQVIFLLLEM